MALVLKDRVKETTSTTGTGTYTLAGAETGFEAFSSIGNSNTTYYCCTDGVDFEIQIVNRWGELVYASSNAFDKWNGTFNGLEIPEDTYFYFIELSSFKYKGAIELRR